MLDDVGTLLARDSKGVLKTLQALPTSESPTAAARPGPLGFDGTGAAAALVPLLLPWLAGRWVDEGTQLWVAGGFGDEALIAAHAPGPGLELLRVADRDDEEQSVRPAVLMADGPFAAVDLVRLLARLAGRQEAIELLRGTMATVAEAADPLRPTEQNPAKAMAWKLWNRVPLLLSARGQGALQGLVQQVFARLGKTLTVPSGEHPLLLATTALEGRHAIGDDLVGLWLGAPDAETALVEEALASRVAQVESLRPADGWLPPTSGDAVVDALTVWYAAAWVASYGALLVELDPAEETVYTQAREAARLR